MKLVARWQFWVLALDLAVLGSNAPGAALAKERHAPKGSHVLFVCTGNFYRSRFAEAIFKAHATPGSASASSRGLDTSKPRATGLSPLVVDELKRLKISPDLVADYPRQLKREDLDAADVVVLLNGPEHAPMLKKQFPQVDMTKVRQWSVPDVPAMAASDAFAQITRQVDLLIVELGAGQPPR
ncbi:MAG: low molecular weight phosphatase family protein [Polyangia bacterium]|jgi:protein-tyrosine phosphatase